MTPANMRDNGVSAVTACCLACGHEADVNVAALPESVTAHLYYAPDRQCCG
jgi:hypothetical protein